MLHEEKLKAVTDYIRAKLPRLMKLEKGCFLFNALGIYEVVKVENDDVYSVDIRSRKRIFYDKESSIIRNCDILGKDIMLNDVLEWINVIIEEVKKEGFEKRIYLYVRIKELSGQWDLTKPYLKDQNEELINFLHRLIEN